MCIQYYPYLYWQTLIGRLFRKPPEREKVDIAYFGEFGYELMLVLPYAYYLFRKGRLRSTRSCKGTQELYYFSPNHTEVERNRSLQLPGFTPNFTPHVYLMDESQWLPPPYREVFANTRFVFGKPLYIIHNKCAKEWMGKPVNMLSIQTLGALFSSLKHTYQIVYIRPGFACETDSAEKGYVKDQNAIQYLPGETELLMKNHPEVLTIQAILAGNPDITYNEAQLLLHANCSRFISVQGGNAVLASYFGGRNIIFAKKGRELHCRAFEGHYRKYGGADIIVARTQEEILSLAASDIVWGGIAAS